MLVSVIEFISLASLYSIAGVVGCNVNYNDTRAAVFTCPTLREPDDVLLDWIFLLITGVIAYHALTHRNDDGENDFGHMLFGAISLLFFMRVLLVDLLGLF